MVDTVSVRPPAVAGSFYPSSKRELAQLVATLLADARRAAPAVAGRRLKALIAPHAGYVYSGAIAASVFALVDRPIARVVLIGPAHRVYCPHLASPGVDRLATPLGEVAVDVAAIERVGATPNPAAHAREHSLEVELPFVQAIAPNAVVVPLIVSDASAHEVGTALDALWGGDDTLIVISSDLSHYMPYDDGRATDRTTADRIVALATDVHGDEACGAAAINGLAWVATRRRLAPELVDLRSSGDTAGSRREVVGYGAFAFYEPAAPGEAA
jgi:AmmeMemoRadiSam system protein B